MIIHQSGAITANASAPSFCSQPTHSAARVLCRFLVCPDVPLNDARPHHGHRRKTAMYHYRFVAALARIWVVVSAYKRCCHRGSQFRGPTSPNGKTAAGIETTQRRRGAKQKVGPRQKSRGPTSLNGKTAAEIKKTEVGPLWAPRGIIIKGSKKSGGPTSRLGCFLLLAALWREMP